jgi:predicted DNA binding protein
MLPKKDRPLLNAKSKAAAKSALKKLTPKQLAVIREALAMVREKLR